MIWQVCSEYEDSICDIICICYVFMHSYVIILSHLFQTTNWEMMLMVCNTQLELSHCEFVSISVCEEICIEMIWNFICNTCEWNVMHFFISNSSECYTDIFLLLYSTHFTYLIYSVSNQNHSLLNLSYVFFIRLTTSFQYFQSLIFLSTYFPYTYYSWALLEHD